MTTGLLQRYFLQPDELPDEVRNSVIAAMPGQKLRAYAMSDLASGALFGQRWVVLGETQVALADLDGADHKTWKAASHDLAAIEKFELLEGLTTSRLNLVGSNAMLLASLHFTRRQSRAMGNLQFIAEQTKKRIIDKAAPAAIAEGFNPGVEYRDAMLKSVKEAKASLAMPKMGVMMRLLGYLKPHKGQVTAALVFSVLMTVILMLPPQLMRILVDSILKPAGSTPMALSGKWLVVIIVSLAAVYGFSELFSFFRLRIMAFTGEKIARAMRDDLYSHMQKLSLSFFSNRTTGSLITRVTSDSDRLWDFIAFGMIDMLMAVIQLVGVAVALLIQEWSLALLVLIPVPVMVAMFYGHSRQIHMLFLRIWRKWAALSGVLSDVIPGMRVVKAFAQEDHEVQRFHRKNEDIEREAIALHRVWTAFWPAVVVMMHTCTIIVWAVGAPRVMRYFATGGAEGMPLGIFIAFTGYMWMFFGPVQQLGMMSRTINRVTTSASRVFEILDTVPTIVSKPDALHIERIEGRVDFDSVAFSYDGVRNVLKGVTFAAKPGEMIGLVGPSGGGKTTLVNLICRFYDVKDGSVRIDGIDVRDLELPHMRRQIGVVLQEPYLFHGTIAENLSYGSHNASIKQIIEAARAANAHEFICGLPDGYDTIVGERGQTLSGGERQRISIARAILHDPRILILDEATSSVDTETEKKIQEALRRLVAGRTTFAIAHRLSTLSAATRLFVMEEGKLIESGTHAELLSRPDGVYAKLHKTQAELHAAIAV